MERRREEKRSSITYEIEVALSMYEDPTVREAVTILSLDVLEVEEASALFAKIAETYHVTPDELNVVIEIIQSQDEYRKEE